MDENRANDVNVNAKDLTSDACQGVTDGRLISSE